MNKALLRSIMALHGDTNRDLGELLGKSEQTISAKMNESGSEFNRWEIKQIIKRYNLTAEQVQAIFFA